MDHYIALIRKMPNHEYRVDFPDVPVCTIAGSNIAQTLAAARDSLSTIIAKRLEQGTDLPKRSALWQIAVDAAHAGAVATLIPAWPAHRVVPFPRPCPAADSRRWH